MTIFLILVVIVLLIVFNSIRSSQVERLEEKITHLERLLRQQITLNSQAHEKLVEKSTHVEPKVVTSQEKIDEIKAEPETQTLPISDININIPVPETQQTEPIAVAFTNNESSNQPKYQESQVTEQELSWYEAFRKNNPDLEKFIGENILSKVAIVVLVLGVAFFVKFAIDKNWINEIARVGIGILTGGIVMGVAHRLHKQFKAFSSVLVAGAITIFYFTIGIAFHQYHIFNQTTAFIIMFTITGFAVFISIVYNRVELAALSLIGGFATPLMVSTGGGNYLVLFSYILILDIGMLVLAYLRKWNVINLMAYIFTMLFYIVWLETRVINKPDAAYFGHLIFGALFYVVFMMMNVIHNIKLKEKFGTIELSILISNTFIFYGFGMQILSYWHPELKGLFSACLALFNLIISWLLYKKYKADEKLVYLLIGLTLTFVTLIAPVQLKGNYITLFWALESVLLIWLSQKSGIMLYRFASVVILIALGFSLVIDWVQIYGGYHEQGLTLFLNKAFITGLVSTGSVAFTIWLLKQDAEKEYSYLGISMKPKVYASILSIFALICAYFTGVLELSYQLNQTSINPSSVSITLFAYHLLFFVMIQLINNTRLGTLFLIINYVNLGIYTLVFILFTLYDFKSYMFNVNYSTLGFWMHYVIIVSAVISIRNIYLKATQSEDKFTNTNLKLNTVLLSFFITFLISVEAIILGLKFSMSPLNPDLLDTVTVKIQEYYQIHSHIIKIVFPILWGLIAFVFLVIGMKKNHQMLRVMSLVLIAITLIKLFTYDIKDASEAGKIIAFIMLGVVLLIISFMYQKIKALIVSDTINNKEE